MAPRVLQVPQKRGNMGEIVQLPRRPRKKYIRSLARECLSEALSGSGDPIGVVVVSVARDGSFCFRMTAEDGAIHSFDLLSRAGSIIDENRRLYVVDQSE